MISYMSVEIIKQNLWIVYLVLSILGAIGGIIYLKKVWSEKISPRLHRWYEAIKSKMPKRIPKEELEKITKEIEKVKNAIEEMKFKPEISDLTAEEKRKLSVSCISSKFKLKEVYPYPPSVEFEFEIDNRYDQSFILDRFLFTASAGPTIGIKWYLCDDIYLDRIIIKGNDKTSISKESIIGSPIGFEGTNKDIFDVKYDSINWEIGIKMFFEGSDGIKSLSATISSRTVYSDWERWYKKWRKNMKIEEYEDKGHAVKP